MPTRLIGQFGDSLNDPELLSLRSEIALVDSAIADLLAIHHDPLTFISEICPLLEQRRKLTDSERSRMKDMSLWLTAEQAMMFAKSISNVIREHVHDPAALNAISEHLRQILKDPSTE